MATTFWKTNNTRIHKKINGGSTGTSMNWYKYTKASWSLRSSQYTLCFALALTCEYRLTSTEPEIKWSRGMERQMERIAFLLSSDYYLDKSKGQRKSPWNFILLEKMINFFHKTNHFSVFISKDMLLSIFFSWDTVFVSIEVFIRSSVLRSSEAPLYPYSPSNMRGSNASPYKIKQRDGWIRS